MYTDPSGHSLQPHNSIILDGQILQKNYKPPVLRKGSMGEDVRRLQMLLNRKGANLKVDGDFGDKTEAAVEKYQDSNKLGTDGIVGPITWKSLMASSATSTTTATVTPNKTNESSKGFVKLPEKGNGYVCVREKPSDVDENWGTKETVNSLISIGQQWSELSDIPMQINDISMKDGQKFGIHQTHREGKTVDIRLIRNDNVIADTNMHYVSYSRERTKKLIDIIRKDANVKSILFNDIEIINYFKLIPGPPIKSYPGHDDHLHVTFYK